MFTRSIVGGPGINVSNAFITEPTMSGMMIWDNNAKAIRIADSSGASQQFYTNSPMISFTPDVESVVNWARIKMAEERSLLALMEKHPGLKDAKEKYEIMLALVKQEA